MAVKRVSKTEFKAKALEYFRLVESTGEHMIVTDHGKAVVEVRKVEEGASPTHAKLDAQAALEELRGSVLYYEGPFDPVGLEDWEALK